MRISFFTHQHGLNVNTGYGYAGFNIVRSLQNLGCIVPFQDAGAPVQINFTPPNFYPEKVPGQYSIGYTPWESTELKPGWLEKMNEMDEIWTPSDLIATWFKEAGVLPPIYVYEHGVSHAWAPALRERTDQLNFLHHGAEASRKCGQITLDAFLEVFGRNNSKVCLTFKTNGPPPMRIEKDSFLFSPMQYSNNIKVVSNHIDLPDLISLYHMNDVMMGLSSAEGFGFAPLQAMATAMPTIINPVWAPYKRFADPKLSVGSRLINSPWKIEHPGKVFEPDFESLCNAMESVYMDFEDYAEGAYETSLAIHKEYDWLKITEKSFSRIFDKFS